MTLLPLKPIVLIGSSRSILDKQLIESKVKKILSHLDDYEVIVIGEDNNFLRRIFSEKIINTIPLSCKSRVIQKTLDEASHIILFWDGADISEFVYRALLSKKKTRIIPVETTKVVNKDRGEAFDVYIGRGTPWGNPYAIGADGMDRDEVIEKYKKYFKDVILTDENKKRDILTLRGKTLGCHCKPQACHGDIIAEYLNSGEVNLD
jgi:hypothetical protein